jgi:fatty acid desaturase
MDEISEAKAGTIFQGLQVTSRCGADSRAAECPRYARWSASFLNDPRDVVLVALMIQCTLAIMCGVGLWLSRLPMLVVAPFYWVGLSLCVLDRFTLMLHCTSHRALFRSKYRVLNLFIPWVLGPFFGQTPDTYFAHHIGMHHSEENLHADLSSTIAFQRDRFGHWLHYFARFMFRGVFDLLSYFSKRKRQKLLRRVLLGEGIYWSLMLVLTIARPAATLVVFIAPLLFMRTLMMIGNWAQHAFVCSDQPHNPYRASIVCVNTRYNRRCFNDGYHIVHHLKPRCHWTEHPDEFERDLTRYGEQDAIVFEGIDFFQVWLYLMLKRWELLARRFVQLPGAPQRSTAEVVAFLRSRTRPIAGNLVTAST